MLNEIEKSITLKTTNCCYGKKSVKFMLIEGVSYENLGKN